MKSLLLAVLLFVSISYNSQAIVDKTITSGGIARTYKLYVPASYSAATPAALVVNMHGLGGNSLQQLIYGDFRSIADTANFIIVHPQGTFESTMLMANYWNAYFGGAVDDIRFIAEMIDTISSNYNIDINRVHATGMSNGGYMSLALAAGLRDKIASVASVTGSMTRMFPTTPTNNYAVSVMQIHGTADSTVKYAGDATSISIPSLLNYWISYNNTNTTPVIDSVPDINTTDNCKAIKYTYSGGRDNSEVVHYKIVGGEHSWPNAIVNLGVTNRDFDATKVIWDFFNKHQKVNTVGVNKTEKPSLVSFFNDMNNSRLKIESELTDGNLTYEIYNMNGQRVGGGQLIDKATFVETHSFNSGMYLLRVTEFNSLNFNTFKFLVK
ncbi:MAG: PHB depolymerase family esterase [Flavobacteriales bacterium]